MIHSLLILIVKNEENDILEWICHHTLIGFKKIIIFDNESTDQTAKIIKEASQYFPVEYILWKDNMNIVPGHNKQGSAYIYAIQTYGKLTEWMCFLDADEFLIPPNDENLDTLLNRMSPYNGFSINWMCFGSSHLTTSQNRLVLEAFTLRGSDTVNVNRHVKTFIKPRFFKEYYNPHYIDVGNSIVNLNEEDIQWSNEGITYPNAILQGKWRVHHYVIRSQEHWKRRIARKQPGGNIREWNTFKEYDQNDVLDYTAYESALKVYNKLTELGKEYKFVSTIPVTYDGPMKITSEILCFVDEIFSNGIRGWACDQNSNNPIELSLYIDDNYISSFSCNQTRMDVKKSSINKEFVGFTYTFLQKYLDGEKYKITFKDQYNRDVNFHFKGKLIKDFFFQGKYIVKIIGQVDEPINGNLRGWVSIARDTQHIKFETNCHILVCLGNRPIGSVLANEPRHDVASAHHIDLNSGFSFTIPKELRDGTEQIYRVFLLPEMIELEGSPQQVGMSLDDHIGKLSSIANKITDIKLQLTNLKIKDTYLSQSVDYIINEIENMLPKHNNTIFTYMPWFYLHHKLIHQNNKKCTLKLQPLVSVVCPVYKPVIKDIQTAIWSVLNQTYQNIELILCDDGGNDEFVISEINKIADQDTRVKFIIMQENRGISEATNTCLDAAKGEWIAFFDHDDVLVDYAIERMLKYNAQNQADILYSDEDKIDDDEILSEPMFKTNWNYRYLLGCNYINHLTMIKTQLVKKVGYLKSEYNGAQDHDFLLRCIELIKPEQIIHVPEVLYHWRKTATSTASSTSTKPYVIQAGIKAVSDHLKRRNVHAIIDSYGKHSMYKVTLPMLLDQTVTIIIPFKDQVHFTKKCVDHVLKYTKKHHIEIVLVNNNSQKEETFSFLKEISKNEKINIINYPYAFNYSKINNLAVKKTSSDYIVFLNNDLFVMDDNWLDIMLGEMILDPIVGAVGGKFLYENRTIQHCGVILGWMGVAGHSFSHESEFYPGYGARAWLPHQVSAVTAACMLVRRSVFEETGGFDEKNLKVAFNDIDLCLKITDLGYKIIITPDFIAEHHESISRGLDDTPEKKRRFDKEIKKMRKRWGARLDNDPFYNPSLARKGKPYFDLIDFDEN